MINKEYQFKEGQVWEYETRIGEESSKLTILKVEEYPRGQVVVHIAIDNVNIKSPTSEDSIVTSIEHLPFDLEALEKSVTKKITDNQPIPDFKDGYEVWKLFFDEGDAGVFSTSVKEAVAYTEETMEQE
ncbi:hypothetical protein [Pontibacter chinhatensis]|nr:hypothetical protein [Pontibacter chinhatensis]